MTSFSLAGLLRFRALQETLSAADLAAARRALDGVRHRRTEIVAALAGTSVAASGQASLAAIGAARASAQSMIQDLARLEAAASHDVDKAADSHRRTRTAARSIEKLRDRFESEARREDLRREQSALDEIAVTRAARSRRTPEVQAARTTSGGAGAEGRMP